jgi:hypothetical protein
MSAGSGHLLTCVGCEELSVKEGDTRSVSGYAVFRSYTSAQFIHPAPRHYIVQSLDPTQTA